MTRKLTDRWQKERGIPAVCEGVGREDARTPTDAHGDFAALGGQ